MSRIHRMLDLSTAHLPEHLCANLPAADGVVAYPTGHGALLWVPDDPEDSANAEIDGVPPEVLRIQLHARALDCDYVLFDGDAAVDPALPIWNW